MKKILKGFLSIALMTIMLLQGIEAQAASTIELSDSTIGVTVADSNGTWSATDGTTINGSVEATPIKVFGATLGYSTNSTTLTITNNKSSAALLSFDYVLKPASGEGSITVDGTSTSTAGSYTYGPTEIQAGASITIKLVADAHQTSTTHDKTTVTISNIALVVDTSVTTTFKKAENGSYTVSDGTTIDEIANTVDIKHDSTVTYTLTANANEGYKLLGWYDETNQKYISSETTTSFKSDTDSVIVPKFVVEKTAVFQVGTQLFDDLGDATNYANSETQKTIILISDGIISGNYTIPSGVTLLIPFDAAYTLYTTAPDNVGTAYVEPKAYKTLTMASGSSITVEGAISVSAKHAAAQGSSNFGGSPSSTYGHIKMEADSTITVKSGAALYAWGYITGNGTVTANNGASIYEYFQIADFRGGNATFDMKTVFPFSQYYVQNIEVPLTLNYGAVETVYTTMYVLSNAVSAPLTFIGSSDAMFKMGEGSTVVKRYDPSTDRLIIDMDGDVSIDGVSMKVSIYPINSSNYNLPINSNITINMNSGSATINQDVALLPGAEVYIGKDAELTISEGNKLYIYDRDEWIGKMFVHTNVDLAPVKYSPTRTKTRTTSDLVDAKADINGTVKVNGEIYTTTSGANIISTGGTGKFVLNNGAGTETVTYQATQNGNSATNVEVPITSVKLHNGNNNFTETSDAVAGDVYYWNTIYSKWMKLVDAIVSYDANGGEGEIASTTISKEDIAAGNNKITVAENTFTKENYTFAGWNTKKDGTGDSYEAGSEAAFVTDTTLYAQWKGDPYTISWDIDGDGSVDETTTGEYGVVPTHEDGSKAATAEYSYNFTGWNPELTEVTGEATYTAQFEEVANPYTITFDTAGGTEIAPITAGYGSDITAPAEPTKEGYTFKGWDKEIPTTMPAENITITAQWEINSYTITFDTAGGTEIAAITQNYNTAITAPADPIKVGYKFNGWDSNGDGEVDTFPAKMPANNLTLKAIWTINQYTITFNTDGGTTIEPITKNYGTTIIPPADPTKTGYTFTGWDIAIPATMPAENMTITAQWTINQYTITFDVDGGSAVEPIKADYGDVIEKPADPTKEGYTFLGWDINGDNEYDAETDVFPGTMPVDGASYKAIWAINTYSITFDSNGGSEVESITAEYGKEITKPEDPTKTGYLFKGWDLIVDGETDGEVDEFPATMLAENLKFVALWKINQYTLVFDANGGAWSDSTATKTITADYAESIEVEEPERKGYIFAGWDVNEDGMVDEVELSAMPAQNLELKAVWTINKYTIEFDANGGTWNDDATVKTFTQEYGSVLTAPENPTREGYTFEGWDVEVPETVPAENVTITAQWTVNQYTITFDTDGGSEVASITADYGKAITAPADPEKTGHTFAGWDTEIPTTMPAKDMTITATWNINAYTITFNSNGGSDVASITANYGDDITEPVKPTKEGYSFEGWDLVVEGEGDGEVDTFPATMPVDGATYVAIWSVNTYSITFDTNGGSAIETMFVKYGEAVTAPEDPTREGYTFAGWNGTIPTTMPAENLTFTAKWTINSYTITFDTDGGSAVEAISANYGKAVDVPEAPIKTGYTFLGWDINGDGEYDAETDVFPETMPGKDITITAIWQVKQYTITFNTAGGTTIAAITQNYGSAITAPEDPTRTGYAFAGWDKEIPETMPAENVTITANWTINQYTITFDMDGGTDVAPITQDYNTAITAPANPTKEGYTFAGWDKTIPTTMPAENVTITAQWTRNQYTITFDTDGGDYVAPIKADYGTEITKPADPTKTGYTFKGWDREIPETMPAENVTITAQWEINKYTVTWKNEDGTVLETDENVEYGTTPSYDGDTPEKAQNADYYYVFKGWSPAISAVNSDITYTAQFDEVGRDKFIITFNTAGGTAIDPIILAEGEAVTTPADPSREGYTFAGWDVEIPETMPAENVTITAQWTPIEYTITFNTDGGSTVDAITQGYETAVTAPANPTKEGYTFAGWSPAFPATMPLGGCELTAQWTINEYTITFDTDGGDYVAPITADYGTAIEKPAAPTKTGYTFAGWDAEIPETMPAGDMTIKALWTINEYTITFDTDGGDYVAPVTADYGTAIEKPADPSKEGYTFAGWDTEIPTTMPADDMTIKALWTVNEYTITFVTGGGTAIAPVTANYGTAITKPADPTKTGYTFKGWDKEIPATMPAGDMTITAQWTANVYTAVFDSDGSDMVGNVEAAYLTSYDKPADPSKEGYTFAGWDLDNDNDADELPDVMPLNGFTAKALWTVNQYTITFDSNGGSEVSAITQNFGTGIATPAAPTREGYTFAGWSPEVPTTMPAKNMTLTAQWTVNQYTITYDTDGGNEIEPVTQDYGTAVSAPADPVKTGYTFKGWDVEIPATMPAENITITAKWEINKYTVSWDVNYDGVIDDNDVTEEVTYGETPEYKGEEPVKAADAKYTYTFAGWTPEIGATVQNIVYTPVFENTVNVYEIDWDTDGDGKVDDTTKVAYGSMPTHVDGVRANDEKYTYEFTGWDPEVVEVTGEATYVAQFKSTPVEYTIVFDTDGGTEVEAITAGYGTKIEVADPTKTGCTFAGWDTDGDGKADALPETMPVGGVKAVALWTVNEYTITFNTDGGSEVEAITAKYGSDVTAPADPTKTGYTFTGWDIAIPATMPAEDMTITAQWTINQYTITFDTDGGSEVKAITADYGTKVTAPENPTKEGYTFKGWSADVPATMPAENVTLTAKWEINKYTVTFIVNGEEIEVTQDYGTEIELPEEPTKEGYNFNGWKLVDTEDDEIVMMPTTIPAGDIKVEPYWTIGQYTINYIDTDGTSIYFETLDFDSEIKAPEDPEKTGYTFLGWDIDGDDKADEIPATMPAENVTATALWKINQYTITFDTNGGSKVAAITADYAEAVTVPENPTKEGHTFAGWDKEIPATMPAENMTITAKWTVNEYTITFNTNGGSKVDSITANYGEAVTEPAAPTKEGYTFTGWDAEFPETMPAGGLTLTAQWSLNSYAIGWDVDGDGKEDDWTTVDYGVTPEHEDGAKAATAEYTYVFKGWSPEIAPVKDTITYAAQFEAVPNEYTITFDTDGGSKVKAVTYAYGDEVATPDEPTKDGCTFAGWSPEIPETMPAENVTVTAQWTANTYTITFDTDGGSEVAPITGVYGTAVAEPEAPVKEGYTFAGWNRDFPETMPSRDITLKAQWTINQYTITLDANGGAWSDGEITKTITQDYGTDVLSPVAPTLSGYTFKGWSPKLPDEMPAQNITLTAQWEYSYTGWLTDENGTTYLKNGKIAFYDEFGEIKSNFYYFDENGYVVKGMYTVNNGDTCIFDKETGVWQIEMNDIYQEDGETYWVENGVVTKGAGLKRVVRSDKDGEINYFYFGEDGKAVKDTTLNLDTEEMTKGMLPEWNYTFDEEGVILHDDDTTKNGIVKEQGVKYYYIDGIKVYMGLFKSGDYYYYANTDGKLHTSGTYYCSRMNGLLSAGFYKFDSVGRIVFSGQTYPAEDSDVIRIAGATRYETSFGIADELKSTLGVEKFDSVIIACGTNFADALSGSYLAAKLDAPILMYNTKKDNCAALYDYINKNMNANGTVYILGGTAAVSDKVDTALARFNIVRLGGKDRYETNLLILKEAGVTNEDILVCTGKNFADSLSASAAARPILLVKNSLSAEQKAFLASLNGNKLYILGGEEAVSKSIANEVKAYGAITRIGGATRYETSVLIAKEFFSNPKYAVLAYAENFPDGLCGGPLAINTNGPLILTKTGKEAAATEYVTGNYITSGAVLGGEILISDNAAKKVFGLGADSAIVNR